MYVWEVILINQLKPPLNRDDKARDALTLALPPLPFQEFDCPLMDKWKEQIRVKDAEDAERRKRKQQLEQERREKQAEIRGRTDLTQDEKEVLYCSWLEEYYEPARNELI